MPNIQIERLKKDYHELGHYIAKVEKRGNHSLAHKLRKKQLMVQGVIDDYQDSNILRKVI